jgi:uridine kinase
VLPRIVRAEPRANVQARFPDGRVFEGPCGTPLASFVCEAACPGDALCVAVVADGRLRPLGEELRRDTDLQPVRLDDADGARIYRRSLVLLLVTAAAEVFPEAEVYIEHAAANTAGYFCRVNGRAPFEPAELHQVEERMLSLVALDEPIVRARRPAAEAAELFRARGEHDKARLAAHRVPAEMTLHALRGRWDFQQGHLVPATAYLRHFALEPHAGGFMLHFPHQARPDAIEPQAPYPKLFAVFDEAGRWLARLGIRSAGMLNDAVAAGRLAEISLVAEALHAARIAEIAAQIAAARDVRVVLVAGPSASGKTTFSKRLAVQLLARGRRPFALGLDDYFVDRERTPRGADGRPDFETLAALDRALLEDQLAALLEGRRVPLPHYDFKTGRRGPGPEVTLGRDDVLIVEGIHGLNPGLVPGLPQQALFRVYVSALTQLNLDRHNRVSTSDCRLVRRLVRDAATRGYSARDTLARWEAVTRAEKHNIFAFQEHADAIFNSALVHELAVLRPLAEPLLLQVRPDCPEFVEANRLLSFLRWFRPAAADPVPDNSILREFVGGSILERFSLWPA